MHLPKQYAKCCLSMDEVRAGDSATMPCGPWLAKALARKTGARGLRSILENALLDTMYELPDLEHVQKITVDDSVILEGSKPLILYEESDKAQA